MAFLKRLFGHSEPAPILPVHPNDQNLVSDSDTDWWRTLTLKDCQVMEGQDNVTKVASIKYGMEEEGLSEEEVVLRVQKNFPRYYGNLEDRDKGFSLIHQPTDDDAGLPYVLKDRVNRVVAARRIDADELQAASSFNALIKSLIRSGRI